MLQNIYCFILFFHLMFYFFIISYRCLVWNQTFNRDLQFYSSILYSIHNLTWAYKTYFFLRTICQYVSHWCIFLIIQSKDFLICRLKIDFKKPKPHLKTKFTCEIRLNNVISKFLCRVSHLVKFLYYLGPSDSFYNSLGIELGVFVERLLFLSTL